MRWLKNTSLLPRCAKFSNGIAGFGSLRHQGVDKSLSNACGIPNIVNRKGYEEMHLFKCTTFIKHQASGSRAIGFLAFPMYGARMLNVLHNTGLTPNMLDKTSTACHKFGNFIRQEHSVSRQWLAKLRAELNRRKEINRKRKKRYALLCEIRKANRDTHFNALLCEIRKANLDTLFKFPFIQSFFTKSIPADQGQKINEASIQPPITQYEEELLHPQTPEEVKLAPLLSRANILITRDIEWANIMFAFEQENRYAMMDPCYPQSPVGFIREQSNILTRQLLRTRRPFIAHITDAMGSAVFRVRRPFWWITSTIYAEVDGKEVGVVCRRWHLWRRIYDLYLGNKQFAVVENPGLWNWTFTLKDEDDNTLAQIDRDWRGFGLELFTDAGQYVIRFGNNYSIPKIGLASTVQELEVKRLLTLSERAVAVALAISLDNDFFSRTSGGWGLPILVAGE